MGTAHNRSERAAWKSNGAAIQRAVNNKRGNMAVNRVSPLLKFKGRRFDPPGTKYPPPSREAFDMGAIPAALTRIIQVESRMTWEYHFVAQHSSSPP